MYSVLWGAGQDVGDRAREDEPILCLLVVVLSVSRELAELPVVAGWEWWDCGRRASCRELTGSVCSAARAWVDSRDMRG